MIPPKKTSGVAIAGLIVSLVFCIPFLTSAVGALLGVVGLFTSSRPGKKGLPIAVLAVVIGVLGLIGWSLVSYKLYVGFVIPARDAVTFIEQLDKGDFTSASKFTAPPFNPDDLPGIVDRMRQLGAFKQMTDVRPITPTAKLPEAQTAFAMKARAVFANGIQDVELELVQLPAGWRVTRLQLSDPPGTVDRTSPTSLPTPADPPVPPAPPAP
jgi:hypothetical protein